jgi:hypothetical protein
MSGPPTARSRPAGNRAATRNVQADEANAHGTPSPRQQATRRAVVVSGVVEVDLSRHVDKGGGIWDDARYVVDRALSSCPAGVAVRLRIGRALYVFDPVLDVLADKTVDARFVEVVGNHPDAVALVVTGLRERLEVVA